jgi:hypothetical protein
MSPAVGRSAPTGEPPAGCRGSASLAGHPGGTSARVRTREATAGRGVRGQPWRVVATGHGGRTLRQGRRRKKNGVRVVMLVGWVSYYFSF